MTILQQQNFSNISYVGQFQLLEAFLVIAYTMSWEIVPTFVFIWFVDILSFNLTY